MLMVYQDKSHTFRVDGTVFRFCAHFGIEERPFTAKMYHAVSRIETKLSKQVVLFSNISVCVTAVAPFSFVYFLYTFLTCIIIYFKYAQSILFISYLKKIISCNVSSHLAKAGVLRFTFVLILLLFEIKASIKQTLSKRDF